MLSDGSGLTSRQVATQAAANGHHVEVLAPNKLGLASFTRHVHRVHRVPAFGTDPDGWFDAALCVLRAGRHDALVATQEQVAVLSRHADRVRDLGVALAVPAFASLLRVQDKAAQAATLHELRLPFPNTQVINSPEELLAGLSPPVFVKSPIGTASNAVHYAEDHDAIARLANELDFQDGVVVQAPVAGPLAMIQAVYDHGRLVAWHVNLREREGSSGGASIKRSISNPFVREHLELLGNALHWHGALSLDAILTSDEPCYIDINPRLVEPGNAWRAGTDLVKALLAVTVGQHVKAMPPSQPNVRTHQALLSILGTAQQTSSRRQVARELSALLRQRGPYSRSTEELTPLRRDPATAIPVTAAAIATLVRPQAWQLFASRAVSAYALTPAAWTRIRAHKSNPPQAPT